MTENEKLRALLAEARGRVGSCECGDEACEPQANFVRRLDAALAEPAVRCGDCHGDLTESRPGRHWCDTCDAQRVIAELTKERGALRVLLSALCAEFEGAVAHADWRAAGSLGMSAPFHGDFASATQLPSVVSRMRWWAREMRKVIGEDKP